MWTPAECDEKKAKKDAEAQGMMRCTLPASLAWALSVIYPDEPEVKKGPPMRVTTTQDKCEGIIADWIAVTNTQAQARTADVRAFVSTYYGW